MVTGSSSLPAPKTFAPSREDVLSTLGFFFGDPVVPEKLKDYSEHHAMTCALNCCPNSHTYIYNKCNGFNFFVAAEMFKVSHRKRIGSVQSEKNEKRRNGLPIGMQGVSRVERKNTSKHATMALKKCGIQTK